jgi:glycerophosphoryl diester phosphodiesterase
MIVAHRGASKVAPENTIPAFKQAWKEEADGIEGDFRLTKDGYIVCIHDHDTKRVTNKDLIINKSTLAELRKLDAGRHHSRKYRGTLIPTISEVFNTIPATKQIYIEIKCGTEIIPELLKQIKKSGLKDEQVVIISFNEQVIRELKTQAPGLKTFWLVNFELDKTGIITPSLETVLKTLKAINADGLSSNKAINETFVKNFKQYGHEWHIWTVDDPEEAKKFKQWGVKSITTNTPGEIRKVLLNNNLYKK